MQLLKGLKVGVVRPNMDVAMWGGKDVHSCTSEAKPPPFQILATGFDQSFFPYL